MDVGNTRIKLGLFPGQGCLDIPPAAIPEPLRTLDITPGETPLAAIETWLAPWKRAELAWWIGSVQREFSSRLIDWLRDADTGSIVLLSSADLPLVVHVPLPDRVGIDRLLAAVAANRLRPDGRPAVIVDLGTAITVDLVSAMGAFEGGAILPGLSMSARALHQFTDLLPLVDMPGLADPPAPLGTATVEAMKSGLFWGSVGGVRHLIELLSREVASPPQVFLTGGAAPTVAPLLDPGTIYVSHLTLAGIRLSAGP